MRTSRHTFARKIFPALLAASCFPTSHAVAANGTWTNSTGGVWSSTPNWSSGIVASGTDAVADFSTLNIAFNLTVHLDSSRTVGTLLFADKTLNDHTWTLDNNGSTSNILLLDTSTGTPVINVASPSLSANLTLSGSKGLDKEGVGPLFLNVPATYSGNTTIGAGKILLGVTNALPTTTSLSVSAGASLDLAGHNQFLANLTGNGTISNAGALANLTIIPTAANASSQDLLSGNINLVKSGPNTLFLGGGPSTYTGTTHITAGVLVLTNTNVLPTSTALTIDAGAILDISIQSQTLASLDGPGTVKPSFLVGSRGTLTLNTNASVTSATLLTGHMNFIKDGTGFLTLNTPATYDGNTTISNGLIFCGADNVLPAATPLTLADNGVLDLNGHNLQVASLAGTGDITNQSTTPATLSLNPGSAPPDLLSVSFFGNLSLNFPNACNVTLSGTNVYTGSTTIASANSTLTAGVTDSLPVTTALSLAGTFDLNGHDQQLSALTGNGTITSAAVAQSTFNISSATDAILSAQITGNINFTKSGPARLLVSTPLTYTGTTTLSAGTLAIAANNTLPTFTTLFMNPGTTFDLNGKSQQLKALVGSGTIISTSSGSIFSDLSIVNNTDDTTFATINAPQIDIFKDGNGTLIFAGQVHVTSCFADTGNLQFNAPGNQVGSLDGNTKLTIAAGASVSTDWLSFPAVTINGLVSLNPLGFRPQLSSVNTLAVGGSPDNWTGNLDLADHPFVVRTSSSLATLQNLVAFGHSHNAGITSSTLPPNFGIAVFSNSITQFATFRNFLVNFSDIILSPELLGDANIDGTVNLADLNTVLTHFGQSTPNWTSGNFDYAPTIDLTDLADVLNNFGQINPNASTSLSNAPEPATLLLLTLPVWSSAFRRRRRSAFRL